MVTHWFHTSSFTASFFFIGFTMIYLSTTSILVQCIKSLLDLSFSVKDAFCFVYISYMYLKFLMQVARVKHLPTAKSQETAGILNRLLWLTSLASVFLPLTFSETMLSTYSLFKFSELKTFRQPKYKLFCGCCFQQNAFCKFSTSFVSTYCRYFLISKLLYYYSF